MFLFYSAILLVLTAGALLYPVWVKNQRPLITGHEAALNEEQTNLEIERQSLLTSLVELDLDYAQEKFSDHDFRMLKTGYEQRLIEVLTKLETIKQRTHEAKSQTTPSPASRVSESQWAISTLLALFIISGTAGVYKGVYGKFERAQQGANEDGAPRGTPPVNPLEMVARLEKRLKENPNDLEGQMMAGRSYMTLERWTDAEKAWRKAVELDERNEVAQYNLADVLIRRAAPGNKAVYEEALDHVEKALINVPREPVVLWMKGRALLHLNRTQEADQAWTSALQNLPFGSQDAEFIKKALQDLRAGRAASE